MDARLILLTLPLLLSGCSDDFNTFPATISNATDGAGLLTVTLAPSATGEPPGGSRVHTLPAHSTVNETWRIEVGQYNMTLVWEPSAGTANLETMDSLSICAASDLAITVQATKIEFEFGRGDGFAGC